MLREKELPVGGHVEDAVRALDELRLDAELLLDLGRQTDRPRQVVSGYAVGDLDFHARIRDTANITKSGSDPDLF